MPFFSIILPTKNRAAMAAEAVAHTLSLAWNDFEIVVMDNDDTNMTAKALSNIKDPRLRIVRTGGLSMPDNWEAGFRAAGGEYFYIIGDKIRVSPDALSTFASRIAKHNPEVMTCDGLPFLPPVEAGFEYDKDHWSILTPDSIVRLILDSDMRAVYRFLPMGYSSCYSKTFVRSIQSRYGRMAFPIAPDFTTGYAALFNAKEVHHYYYPLHSVKQGMSAGWSAYYKGNLSESCLKEMGLTNETSYANAKIQLYSPVNAVFNDFFTISEKMGKGYKHDDMDDVKHVIHLFGDIMTSKYRFHMDVGVELRILYAFIEKKSLFAHPRIQEMFDRYDLTKVQWSGDSQAMTNPFHISRLVQAFWSSLGVKKCRVAIFGAGKHTRWLEDLVTSIDGPAVVSVLDDNGSNAPDVFGLSPVRPESFNPADADAVFISSDVPEIIAQMRNRSLELYEGRLKILLPYLGLPRGPYLKVIPE